MSPFPKKTRPERTARYVTGLHPIVEALTSGVTIDKIFLDSSVQRAFYKELTQLALEHDVPYSCVPLVKLRRLCSSPSQGAVALLSPARFVSLEHVIQESYALGQMPFVVLLDRVTDVHNFGAIVRTAICAGVDAIVVAKSHSAALGDDAMRTSAGALAHLPVARVDRLSSAIRYAQQCGLQVVACHERAASDLYQIDFGMPLAVLLGAEGHGIAPQHLKMADQQVKIPMTGPVASLNVSVAAALVMYERVRQHGL